MRLSWILSIDQNVIQIYYNKDIKLFSKNFVDIALKIGGYIGKAKVYYLILKVAVSGTKGHLLLVTFLNPHLVVNTSKIQLGKSFGPA